MIIRFLCAVCRALSSNKSALKWQSSDGNDDTADDTMTVCGIVIAKFIPISLCVVTFVSFFFLVLFFKFLACHSCHASECVPIFGLVPRLRARAAHVYTYMFFCLFPFWLLLRKWFIFFVVAAAAVVAKTESRTNTRSKYKKCMPKNFVFFLFFFFFFFFSSFRCSLHCRTVTVQRQFFLSIFAFYARSKLNKQI